MNKINEIKSLPSDSDLKQFEAYVRKIKLMHALFFPERNIIKKCKI